MVFLSVVALALCFNDFSLRELLACLWRHSAVSSQATASLVFTFTHCYSTIYESIEPPVLFEHPHLPFSPKTLKAFRADTTQLK